MNSVLTTLITDCTNELSDIKNKVDALPPLDKTKIYFTNYALIKACGTVEYVYRGIIADFVENGASQQIVKYIDATIRNGSMSPTYDNMCGILVRFDDNWLSTFKIRVNRRTDRNKIISSSNSLVTNRHAFAHGKNSTATLVEIIDYYQDVVKLIYELDAVVV